MKVVSCKRRAVWRSKAGAIAGGSAQGIRVSGNGGLHHQGTPRESVDPLGHLHQTLISPAWPKNVLE